MGLAHALALPGCADTLTGAFGPRPRLEPYHLGFIRLVHTPGLLMSVRVCLARFSADIFGAVPTSPAARFADGKR